MELYWDETGISSKKKCGPIWLGISNSSQAVKRSTHSRMLAAVLPGNAELANLLADITRQVAELRLTYFYFGCDNINLQCHVTLSLVLGDSPGSNSMIGKAMATHLLHTYNKQAYVTLHASAPAGFATSNQAT